MINTFFTGAPLPFLEVFGLGPMADIPMNLPTPIFKTEGMFTLVLKATSHPKQVRSTENTMVETKSTEDQIIKLIKKDTTISASELAKKIDLTKRGVEYHLDHLKKINRIPEPRGWASPVPDYLSCRIIDKSLHSQFQKLHLKSPKEPHHLNYLLWQY